MYGIEHAIKFKLTIPIIYGKIVPVYRILIASGIHIDPFIPEYVNAVTIIFFLIQVFVDHLAAFEGDSILAGIPPHDDGNIFFHTIVRGIRWGCISSFKVKKKALGFLSLPG